ncbi:hypothetical protein BC826DRAFT_1011990, partial [Russula brevipes]
CTGEGNCKCSDGSRNQLDKSVVGSESGLGSGGGGSSPSSARSPSISTTPSESKSEYSSCANGLTNVSRDDVLLDESKNPAPSSSSSSSSSSSDDDANNKSWSATWVRISAAEAVDGTKYGCGLTTVTCSALPSGCSTATATGLMAERGWHPMRERRHDNRARVLPSTAAAATGLGDRRAGERPKKSMTLGGVEEHAEAKDASGGLDVRPVTKRTVAPAKFDIAQIFIFIFFNHLVL